MIRQHNGITSEPTATLNYRGVHTGNRIVNAWATYFSELATPPRLTALTHLTYGGELLKLHLTALFNAIVSEAYIPKAFQLGMVIPIPKGHNKDLSVPINHRGITILSNISKVFEKLLLLKISQQTSPPPTLNQLQGGFKKT